MNDKKIGISQNAAYVQVWGKGFRVTEDSEEFQRFVPLETPSPSSLEAKLQLIKWGKILEPLYSVPERELGNQLCLLFDTSGLLSISFALTEDRHQRPSLLLTSALTAIDWEGGNINDSAAKLTWLTSRLASAYAVTIRGNSDLIGKQLISNRFLPNRSFDLSEEEPNPTQDWNQIFSAVKRLRGVTGICTLRMLGLGANVLLGTKYEAERARQQFALDGYFDPRENEIRPLTDQLGPWAEKAVSPTPSSPKEDISKLEYAPVVDALDRIERTMAKLADALFQLIELVGKDKRKK